MTRRRLIWGVLAVLAIALTTSGYFYWNANNGKAVFHLAAVERGPLTSSIASTGTLNAVVTVQVGSQISGQIKELNADFNSEVTAGQVIARIDPAIFEAKVAQAKADLDVAIAAVAMQKAQQQRAQADMAKARAALAVIKAQTTRFQSNMRFAKRDRDRRKELFKRGVTSQGDLDKVQSVYDAAVAEHQASKAQEEAEKAAIAASEAQVVAAQAQSQNAEAAVRQREAALKQAMVDLDHTFIRAPVTGVVVSRNVDIGQTVAASLQAPILFLIAQDLSKIQVDASVDEADVGKVKVGQPAGFTVDAFPSEEFEGKVAQIRKAPQVVQNVVTYVVVVSVDNPNEKLLPGMTANLKIITAKKEDVLKVPNAALRFRMPKDLQEKFKTAAAKAPGDKIDGTEPRRKNKTGRARGGKDSGTRARLWVMGPDGKPTSVPVRIGISDSEFTEVRARRLEAGQQIITGITLPKGAKRGGRDRPTRLRI
ncbi:MAG: efflux RND transporter periplasmic adaptor subunit [Rhodospirillales bacterium]